MFRPYFGNSGVFADEMEGKVLDRALQLDLDRQSQPKVAASLPALAGASGSIDVQFMPAEELAQWRDWVVEFVGRGFSWDRLDFMARRAAAGGNPQPFLKISRRLPGWIAREHRGTVPPGRPWPCGAVQGRRARNGQGLRGGVPVLRTVRGLAEAVKLLTQNRGLHLDTLPPHLARSTAEVFGEGMTPTAVAEEILRRVREGGDAAVRDITRRVGGGDLAGLEVPRAAIEQARDSISEEVADALRIAAERIRRFHESSMPQGWHDPSNGYGELMVPVSRVGAYVPGGTARYPSTVLMTVIPARVAGVDEVIVATPGGDSGYPDPVVLAAADVAGADRVFRIGGAQAVAAMAYGTETVPRVDIVCGPGNIFTTLAKKLLFGEVGIDGLYGPTETALVADETANPTMCAADLIAQAEHDEMATPVLITTSEELAQSVIREIGIRTERLDRAATISASVRNRGVVAIVDSLDEAVELANEYAPEHLSLMVEDPKALMGSVRNAGALFLGEYSHEVLGDYVAGPSHVMPTGGTARFNSGIGVRTFLKTIPYVDLDAATSAPLARAASVLGRAEGLTAHAEAAEIREEMPRDAEPRR